VEGRVAVLNINGNTKYGEIWLGVGQFNTTLRKFSTNSQVKGRSDISVHYNIQQLAANIRQMKALAKTD
jgi:hypothetical protein